ncbi:hypothetical protein IGJ28_000224 [Enterococcus sp. AZ091]
MKKFLYWTVVFPLRIFLKATLIIWRLAFSIAIMLR